MVRLAPRPAPTTKVVGVCFFAREFEVRTRVKVQGYTLPELLIGLSLGLMVIAAATAAYGVSRQTWATLSAIDAVHANARMALRVIREHAQIAGAAYLDKSASPNTQLSSSYSPGQSDLQGENGNKADERVALGYWVNVYGRDCQGNQPQGTQVIRNEFKLNTNKELTCKDLSPASSTYQALAEGVEDFQVRYAQANPAAHTLQWKTADQVTAMSQVLAIEVCLRVASVNTVSSGSTASQGCAGETVAADGRLRRVFRRVITLRNRDGLLP
jgi:type IV pilus assembly protein PilW